MTAKEEPTELGQQALRVAEATAGFEIGEKIYESGGGNRNAIYEGEYEGNPAVLKIYRDHRINDEPRSLERFHEENTSGVISAPKLYASEIIDHHAGWLIMERLEGGSFLQSPLGDEDREKFVDILAEYHERCQWSPTRPLTVVEQLPANEYHRYRISRWLRMAVETDTARQCEGREPLLTSEAFIPRFERGLDLIDRTFKDATMTWGHGHIKPKDVYIAGSKIYLTDFGHTKMHPPGYEPAFAVWSDVLMEGDWQDVDLEAFSGRVAQWKALFEKRAKALGMEQFDELWRASLTERCLGFLTADIAAKLDRPDEVLAVRRDLTYRLLDELGA
ncbi:MAG: phosphotransferase [bacterium]|nr:phosphotransferase [bacterium]MDZ4247716.1 phosphotransferase [Patescibacteria group bacterium]